MTVVARFTSRRSNLIVIERPAVPIFEGPRQVGTEPGKKHVFSDHHCVVEGQRSIDFMRERMKAQDGPGIWELEADDVPAATDLLAELATADVARVRAILKAEADGPNREQVVDTCKAILAKAGAAERGPGAQERRSRHEIVTG